VRHHVVNGFVALESGDACGKSTDSAESAVDGEHNRRDDQAGSRVEGRAEAGDGNGSEPPCSCRHAPIQERQVFAQDALPLCRPRQVVQQRVRRSIFLTNALISKSRADSARGRSCSALAGMLDGVHDPPGQRGRIAPGDDHAVLSSSRMSVRPSASVETMALPLASASNAVSGVPSQSEETRSGRTR
jgi:hypothetical protein